MKYVGGVRPEVGTEEFAHLGLCQLRKILRQVALCVAPGEIGVRLRETEHGEPVHDVRTRKRFGEKNQIRIFLLEITNHPFPEVERFRVRIVDSKDVHALFDPEFEDTFQLIPERSPVGCVEFEGINVFVFLRRIFRVLNRSIRPPSEPFRMFFDVGMVR